MALVERHILIDLLQLIELGAPRAVGIDDTIVDEVALVGSVGIVVTCAVLVEAVLHEVTAHDILRSHDRLVDPVPYATTDAILAALEDVPVLLEVAQRVAHGVVVLTHEERLLGPVAIGLRLHFIERRIHAAPHLGSCGATGVGGTLVVDDAVVERLHEGEGGVVVGAIAALVAKAPEHHRRVVAVAQHHAASAVEIGGLPRGVA